MSITIRIAVISFILQTVFSMANAVELELVSHTRSSVSSVTTLITDGSSITLPNAGSAVVWNWDPATETLSSLGVYRPVLHFGGSPYGTSVFIEEVTNLKISSGVATATAYTCVDGSFPASVGWSLCGNYVFGANFIDESTTTYMNTTITQIIGGDDESTGVPRGLNEAFGDLVLKSDNGSVVMFWNGIPEGTDGSTVMTFAVVPGPSVTISVTGGIIQECSELTGAPVDLVADVSGIFGDPLATIEWFLDSTSIGFGESLQIFVPVGSHIVEVLVTSGDGKTAESFSPLDIVDTTSPTVSASFADAIGRPITSVSRGRINRVQTRYEVSDVCDPDLVVSAMAGVDVSNGQFVVILGSLEKVLLKADHLELRVLATDASGNVTEEERTLTIEAAKPRKYWWWW